MTTVGASLIDDASGGKRLRAGVIGLGVGIHHAHAFMRHPGVELVAMCDIRSEAHAAASARLGIPVSATRFYLDHREMLRAEALDLVSVATPDAYHADPVIDAANAGVRGILCEKPLAATLPDADRMIDASRRAGATLLVDHTRNFDVAYVETRAQVEAGAIGRLTRIVAYLGGRRAMLFRNHTHLLGSIRFFAGAGPEWIFAALDDGFEGYGLEYRGEGGRDPMLDPGGTFVIHFENGVRALVMASKGTPSTGVQLDLLGTRGRITVGDKETRAWIAAEDEGALSSAPVTWAQGITGDLGERLVPAVRHLVDLVTVGGRSLSPPEEARDVLAMILGALRSQHDGPSPVRLVSGR